MEIEINENGIELNDEIIATLSENEINLAQELLDSVLFNYLAKGNKNVTSATHWINKYNYNEAEFSNVAKVLSYYRLIDSSVFKNRNWSEITAGSELVSQAYDLRHDFLMAKYSLRKEFVVGSGKDTKWGTNETHDTGITRENMAKKAVTSEFLLDTEMMVKYREPIIKNIVKSMDKILDKNTKLVLQDVNYRDIAIELFESYIANPKAVYNSEANRNDSRGRAIKLILKRVFNYIGFKDARSVMIIPMKNRKLITEAGLQARYLFIAELLGYKAKTISDKVEFGIQAYKDSSIHTLDLDNEDDRKELHENIWLERIYRDLTRYYANSKYLPETPIEIDATASMLQYEGALLDHKTFLKGTNCITKKDKLNDIWTLKGIPRKQFKFALTPILYGSSQSCINLWIKNDITNFTDKQVVKTNRELKRGKFSVANDFSKFIIDNVQPSEEMYVNVNGERFYVKCNRFKQLGEYLAVYAIYDSNYNEMVTIQQTQMSEIPDLKQFKRYFVTLLVHCLDSQVADDTMNAADWILDIHDAFIIVPEDALAVRTRYASNIDKIYANREEILANYFRSIGINLDDPKVAKQWARLQNKCDNVKNFKCSLMALK